MEAVVCCDNRFAVEVDILGEISLTGVKLFGSVTWLAGGKEAANGFFDCSV